MTTLKTSLNVQFTAQVSNFTDNFCIFEDKYKGHILCFILEDHFGYAKKVITHTGSTMIFYNEELKPATEGLIRGMWERASQSFRDTVIADLQA